MPGAMQVNPAQLNASGGTVGQPLTLGGLGFTTANSHVPVGFIGLWFRASVVAGRTLATLPTDWRICDGSTCSDPGITAPTVPTAVLSATVSGGAPGPCTTGTHVIAVTFEDQFGYESIISTSTSTVTVSASKNIDVTNIATGPANIQARRIYMSKASTTSPLFLAARIADNSTTQLTGANGINISDTNLTVQAGPGGGPWNGLALPTISAKFPRGHSTLTNANFGADIQYRTGGTNVPTGGSDSNNFAHNHDMNSHTHGLNNHTHDLNNHTHGITNSAGLPQKTDGSNTTLYANSSTGTPSNNNTGTAGGNTSGPSTASTQNNLGSTDNRPAFAEMLYIIKIR